uniref:(northern house mosquito) hypothetical protein n=1 Tax=Culex pipiens TaxID=7175 RepID=A0A8D8IQ41_CULPI
MFDLFRVVGAAKRILLQQIRSAGVRAVLQQIVLPDTVQLRAVLPDDHGPDVLLWVKFSRQSIQTGDASRGRCHGQFDGDRSGRGLNGDGDDHHRNRRQFVLRGDTDGHLRRDVLLGKAGRTRSETERINFTHNGGDIIRFYSNNYPLDDTGDCGDVHRIKDSTFD